MAESEEMEIWVVEHAALKQRADGPSPEDWRVWDSRNSFATPKEVLDRCDELTRENGKVLQFRGRRYVPALVQAGRDLIQVAEEVAGG